MGLPRTISFALATVLCAACADGDSGSGADEADSPTEATVSTDAIGDPIEGPDSSDSGRPNSGFVYVTLLGGGVVIVDGETVTPADLGDASAGETKARGVIAAPAGTPNAGTVYTAFPGVVVVITPDGEVSSVTVPGIASSSMVVGPAGAPNAGTVYGETWREGVWGINPDGSTFTVGIGEEIRDLTIAPDGTPNAGTVYATHVLGNLSSITPAGDAITIATGGSPLSLAVAPAGVPNAGMVYSADDLAFDDNGTVWRISPDGNLDQFAVTGRPNTLEVAPEGTPNAGTLYSVHATSGVVNPEAPLEPGKVLVIDPDGATSTVEAGIYPVWAAIAPMGTPNEGSVYVGNSGDGTVTVLRPDGTVETIEVGGRPNRLAVAPVGTPNAGTVFVTHVGKTWDEEGNKLSVIPVDGSPVSSVDLGDSAVQLTVAP